MAHETSRPRRADAVRNREKILAAARDAFAHAGGGASMAEIARRAGVGMATLYRNFPQRRDLLEALYVGEVDAVCDAARTVHGETSGAAFEAWVSRFLAFFESKHDIAIELLDEADPDDPIFDGSRTRVLAAGRPLLAAAQAGGDIRPDLTLEQILDLVIAVGRIRGERSHREPIIAAALSGIRNR